MSPRVVYAGNFAVPWTTENEVASCFEALGWTVERVQEDEAARWPGRLLGAVDGADLVLYTRTWGMPEGPTLALWEHCASVGIPTATLHLDLFYGLGSPKGRLPRYEMPARDPMFRTAHVFTPDGDHDEEWKRDGVNHHWLPPAIGCDSCWDGERDERWADIDVAFVGSRGYHPEWAHRPRLIDELQRRFGSRFAHVSGETLGQALRGPALHDLYATVPLVVGDSAWTAVTPPTTKYISDRWYETTGRGGLPIWPRIDFLEDDFGEYPWWEPWDDFDAMETSIRWWLGHPEACRLEQQRLTKITRERHTWSQRIETMLDVMGVE